MQNIILVGLMGSGKSGVGRTLAARLGLRFVDSDDVVVQRAGKSIPEIFASEGEAAFRHLEAQVLAALLQEGGQVVATGGGSPVHPETRRILRRHGRVIWLQASPAELLRRIQAEGGPGGRPLLHTPDPLERLQELLAARAAIYAETCHCAVQTEGLAADEVAEAIIQRLQAEPGGAAPDPGH